ncbi:MAG: hypothetical protein ACI9S8_003225, partial [Chlamydiales bacterium]
GTLPLEVTRIWDFGELLMNCLYQTRNTEVLSEQWSHFWSLFNICSPKSLRE